MELRPYCHGRNTIQRYSYSDGFQDDPFYPDPWTPFAVDLVAGDLL